MARHKIWVVVPAYRVKTQIARVLQAVPGWVVGVVIVDDCCPEKSGDYVESEFSDPRFFVLRNPENLGVGGAVLNGYRYAQEKGARIIVKVDGDDQMDMRLIPALVAPIIAGLADYTKGNRFSSLSHVQGMPAGRVFGNSMLSLMSKISTGYWNMFDPTNGFTAIEARVAKELQGKRIAKRYFFESDLLYHLGTIRAVVRDVPMPSRYADETSNLRVLRIIVPFLYYHFKNTIKRFVGQYLVRDFSVASVETLVGLTAIFGGLGYGISYTLTRHNPAIAASAGVVMVTIAPVIIGVQFLLSALNFDVLNVPKEPVHKTLAVMDEFMSENNVDG